MDELHLRAVDYDIVGITESWGTDDISDAELNLPGFQLFRNDRNTRGGDLLYVSEAVEAVHMEDIPTFGFADCIWCKLCIHGIKLIVGVCYRSPVSSSVNDEALLLMFNSVGELADASTWEI